MTHNEASKIIAIYTAIERAAPLMKTTVLFKKARIAAKCNLAQLHAALDMHHASRLA